MKKIIYIFILAISVAMVSCNQGARHRTVDTVDTTYVTIPEGIDDIVRAQVTDNRGRILNMTYYNREGRAEMELNGQIIELSEDTTASGIGFSNDDYVFREWQGDITLTKNGVIVFDTRREINNALTDDQGNRLQVSLNNLNGSATMTFNGEVILMSEDTAKTGIKYSNARYIFEESQDQVTLRKDGQTVFNTQK